MSASAGTTEMTLESLIRGTAMISITGGTGGVVRGLCCDSRSIRAGDLFFALPGTRDDGGRHVAEAVAGGAIAVVSGGDHPGLSVPLVRVADARAAMADLAAAFYAFPSSSLAVTGVTGTNGKTTTAWMIRHLCMTVGRSCGLIGTIEYILPGEVVPATRTTPESIDIQRMLARMSEGGFRAASLEVSSHALVQQRVRAVQFDAAVFTNLSQDHLDYHASMEAYFEAKLLLFTQLASQTGKKGKAVINSDERYGHRLIDRITGVPVITYGQGSNCNFRASNIRCESTGTTFRLDARGRSYLVRTPFIGLFNVYNTLAAVAAVAAMGLELRRVVAAAATVPQVPGRLQRVPGRRAFQAYVDYAHTPDALENVLRALRQLNPARIITVFGCGGDRDSSKRPLMAAAAERHSDHVILTSDNPRSEDPSSIIRDAERGFRGAAHASFIDRESAIRSAVQLAGPGDVVLIAGKGHENYQETATGRHPFDDVSATVRAMAAKPSAEAF